MSGGASAVKAGLRAAPTCKHIQMKILQDSDTADSVASFQIEKKSGFSGARLPLCSVTSSFSNLLLMATKINSSDELLILTLAWYCSRITWPGNSGSGMAENCLMITRSVWSPASRSSSLWSVDAINAMRTRSPRWRTRKSERNGWEINDVWDIQKHKPSKSLWGLTSGVMQASFLSKRHVKVSWVGSLALCYDATHTLHGETTCGWAQRCEWATRLRPGSEGRGVIIFARVCVFILLFRLQWGTTIFNTDF